MPKTFLLLACLLIVAMCSLWAQTRWVCPNCKYYWEEIQCPTCKKIKKDRIQREQAKKDLQKRADERVKERKKINKEKQKNMDKARKMRRRL